MALRDDLIAAGNLVAGKIDQLIQAVKDNQGGVSATDAQSVISTQNAAAARAEEVLTPTPPPTP